MKSVLGLALIIIGVAVGLYVGLWVCLAGGIISIVNGIESSPMGASMIAWGFVKIICASFVGWISAMVFIVPGYKLIMSD